MRLVPRAEQGNERVEAALLDALRIAKKHGMDAVLIGMLGDGGDRVSILACGGAVYVGALSVFLSGHAQEAFSAALQFGSDIKDEEE